MIYGIPETIFVMAGLDNFASSGRRASKSNSIRTDLNFMDLVMFDATLNTYSLKLKVLLRDVYIQIFGVELDTTHIQFNQPPEFNAVKNNFFTEFYSRTDMMGKQK